MLRIIVERDDNGVPTKWHDCREVEAEEASYADADRFDDEIGKAPRLGVGSWAEVTWILDDLRLQLLAKASELSDAGADDDELWKWLSAHPRYRLMQTVTTWAALAVAGHGMSVAEVYRLPGRDVLQLDVKEPEDRRPGKPRRRRGTSPGTRRATSTAAETSSTST